MKKTIPQLKKEAQKVFNAWVRNRDKDRPCISCGKPVEKKFAGHYWSQGGHSFLRYHPDNCHVQCFGCNNMKSGNLLEYRFNLIRKIGQERVGWLDEHRNEIKKWTREELEEVIKTYK